MTATPTDPRLARAILGQLTVPGDRRVADLIREHGPVGALELLGGVAAPVRTALGLDEAVDRAERDLARAECVGARLVIPEDAEWPPLAFGGLDRLRDRNSASPVALWVRGPHLLADAVGHAVSVVGARDCTEYGLHSASEWAYRLADEGWTVVSGGAIGIDAAAHRGALAAGGTTIAVLASGVDCPYPAGNATLLERIAERGLLLSEWPPGSAPQRHWFLIRNRVIAALSTGTVVVEAAARSGARTTARRAAELGRAVMAVPGPITSSRSVGCHQLVRDHDARLVTRVAEVLEEIGRLGDDLAEPVRGPDRPEDALPEPLRRLLDAVPRARAVPVEQIAIDARADPVTTLRGLAALELHGFVEDTGAGYRLLRQGGTENVRPRG
jgi:DNA processing protein